MPNAKSLLPASPHVSNDAAERAAPLKYPRVVKAPPPSPARAFLQRQARMEWDTRLGRPVKAAANWRLASFGQTILNIIGAVTISTLATAVVAKPKAIPYVVEIDRIGTAVYHGPAADGAKNFVIPERAIRQQLKRFVTDLRSLSSDPAIITANIVEAAYWATPVGQNLINKFIKDNDPYKRCLQERVSVEIQSVLALSRDSWRVQWKETSFDPSGAQVGSTLWGGAFRLVFRTTEQGVEEEMLEKNLLGLYVDYFDVQQLKAE
jgi:type IV secretory pathway TrbF-like protein